MVALIACALMICLFVVLMIMFIALCMEPIGVLSEVLADKIREKFSRDK